MISLRDALNQTTAIRLWRGPNKGHDGALLVFHLRDEEGQVVAYCEANSGACIWDQAEDFARAVSEVTGNPVAVVTGARKTPMPNAGRAVTQAEIDELRPR